MMYARPQEDHVDLGLISDDRTEDLRPAMRNAPGRCWNTAEGLQNYPPTNEQEL